MMSYTHANETGNRGHVGESAVALVAEHAIAVDTLYEGIRGPH